MPNETDKLAEKIAALIRKDTGAIDLGPLHASIDAIECRLAILESAGPIPNSNLSQTKPHPSLDRFAIAEAIADGIFDRGSKEKACTFEPNGKPCDHCSMCNSRGF